MEPAIEKRPFREPPEVITTACGDLWPRPYIFEDGLRRVAPYHFTYNTNCKQRWRGRELLEVFASEFRDRPQEYYVSTKYSLRYSILMSLERCHRTRFRYRQRKSSRDYSSIEERRRYITHSSSSRASCDSASYWYHPRR